MSALEKMLSICPSLPPESAAVEYLAGLSEGLGAQMTTGRVAFDVTAALYDEAVAMYESAKAECDALHAEIERRLSRGGSPTDMELLLEEERARAALFVARVRLSRRQHHTDYVL